MGSGKERLADIDIGKGIAIVLVVLGHVVARDIKPVGNDWFQSFQIGLYSFHMAFFFYLAGQVFWTAAPAERPGRLRRAANRMLPAYVLMALLAFAAKLALAPFMPVDRPVGSLAGEWATLLMYPTEGFVSFLWFIVVVLTLYALTLFAARVVPGGLGVIIATAFVAHLLSLFGHVTKLGALHYAMMNWLFFTLGCWAMESRRQCVVTLRRAWPWPLLALVVALAAVSEQWQWTVPPLLALPALHGLSLFLAERGPRLARWLSTLGSRSWPIYLFNTFAIGAMKVIILKTMGWDGPRFFVALPLLLAAGLLLPLLLQRWVLSRVAWLDRITR